MIEKCYSDILKLQTFEERFEYLRCNSKVMQETFGIERYLNQNFYRSAEWHRVRAFVITRDNGCDLGILSREILDEPIFVHHMNPITSEDITHASKYLLDPEYLISVRKETHNAIHYGGLSTLGIDYVERTPNDTCPWRNFL